MRRPQRSRVVVVVSFSDQAHLERSAADRFVRRLLVVGDTVDRNAILGARRSTTMALVISGIRCTLTYLIVPLLAPFLGLLWAVDAPLSIGLSLVAILMGISGVRRFWLAEHRLRWPYTLLIASVTVLLVAGIGFDLASLHDV